MSTNTLEISSTEQSFQRLSLSIPSDINEYNFICLFLSRVLNLSDETELLQRHKSGFSNNNKQIEILPNISFPQDIWLQDELTIKEIKIKTTILQEINHMITSELSDNFNNTELDATLSYYEKLSHAYGFFDLSISNPIETNTYSSTSFLMREEEEGKKDYKSYEHKEFEENDKIRLSYTSVNSTGTIHSNGGSPFFTKSNLSIQKKSAGKDFTNSKKRFSTLLGYKETSDTCNQTKNIPEDEQKQQAINNLLAKSRLYNKIRKHRESSGSANSNISYPSNYSNRNSISTTNTTTSCISRKRSSNLDMNEQRLFSSRTSQDFSITALSPMQRQENKRNKHSYYIQLNKLHDLSQELISRMNQSASILKLIQFIKSVVLKFIIIDIQQMIIGYAQLKAYGICYMF